MTPARLGSGGVLAATADEQHRQDQEEGPRSCQGRNGYRVECGRRNGPFAEAALAAEGSRLWNDFRFARRCSHAVPHPVASFLLDHFRSFLFADSGFAQDVSLRSEPATAPSTGPKPLFKMLLLTRHYACPGV